ncbi:secretory subunit [Marasmius sp. AFHP31]|nr:secretory subunit [Marasmius sp. AFHP31]
MKITHVPYVNSDAPNERDYRSYKIQFQAPNGPGLFTWKIYLISDTFVGEEVSRTMTLKIDDASALDTQDAPEDEISDPEEDSLAGQMAAMRGGPVKKSPQDEESDEESSTDDDQESEDDSSSDDD